MTSTLISKVLEMTPQGAAKWKKEERKIIDLLEKYFTSEDLEEFLQTGGISRYDTNETRTQEQTQILLRRFFIPHVASNICLATFLKERFKDKIPSYEQQISNKLILSINLLYCCE